MVKIKTVDEIAAKWSKETPTRAPYYEAEVKVAGGAWVDGAKKGQDAYKAAMADTATLDRRLSKITDVASGKYQDKAGTVGPARFRDGVSKSGPYFSSGFSPSREVIAAWVPPKRGPRGDPANYDIPKSIGDALHKKRVGA